MAVFGYWSDRLGTMSRPLAVFFPAMMIGHLDQTESSSSTIGERYWFEAYFAVTLLAARGLSTLISSWRTAKPQLATAMTVLTCVQIGICMSATHLLDSRSLPRCEVRKVAEEYRERECIVFLEDSPPVFFGEHLNLNEAEWKRYPAFYLVDPGPGERAAWAKLFGRSMWVVIKYDEESKKAFAREFYNFPSPGRSTLRQKRSVRAASWPWRVLSHEGDAERLIFSVHVGQSDVDLGASNPPCIVP
jgi:hypothetical protein